VLWITSLISLIQDQDRTVMGRLRFCGSSTLRTKSLSSAPRKLDSFRSRKLLSMDTIAKDLCEIVCVCYCKNETDVLYGCDRPGKGGNRTSLEIFF